MTPLWLDAVFAVVQMAILIGLIALGIWMVKRSFRIKRKWVCWLVRILGVLISWLYLNRSYRLFCLLSHWIVNSCYPIWGWRLQGLTLLASSIPLYERNIP